MKDKDIFIVFGIMAFFAVLATFCACVSLIINLL